MELGLQFMGALNICSDRGIIVVVHDKKKNIFSYDKICD